MSRKRDEKPGPLSWVSLTNQRASETNQRASETNQRRISEPSLDAAGLREIAERLSPRPADFLIEVAGSIMTVALPEALRDHPWRYPVFAIVVTEPTMRRLYAAAREGATPTGLAHIEPPGPGTAGTIFGCPIFSVPRREAELFYLEVQRLIHPEAFTLKPVYEPVWPPGPPLEKQPLPMDELRHQIRCARYIPPIVPHYLHLLKPDPLPPLTPEELDALAGQAFVDRQAFLIDIGGWRLPSDLDEPGDWLDWQDYGGEG